MLLPTSELRKRLVTHFRQSERSWVYSAFVTFPGIKLILEHRDVIASDRLLVRCSLSDVLAGACSLDALELALSKGMQIRISSALHVKLYFFDAVLFVGSANLTGSGLALVGYCNDELSTEGLPSQRDVQIAENLWSEGVNLGARELAQMRDFVGQLSHNEAAVPSEWPENIFSENRSLYCSDFPQGGAMDEHRWVSREQFEASVAYRWIIEVLRQNDGEASFGLLSSQLHNDVYDEPGPYRREIKDLLVNLISLIDRFKSDQISITVPRHTQVLRLNY